MRAEHPVRARHARAAKAGERRTTRRSRRSSGSSSRAARFVVSRPGSSTPSRACSSIRSSSTGSSASASRSARRRGLPDQRSSSWRRACPSSCGAASRTRSCWALAAKGRLAIRRARAADAPHAVGCPCPRPHRQPRPDSGSNCASSTTWRRERRSSTAACVRRSGARPSCCSRPSSATIAASSTCSTLTTRSSMSGSPGTTAFPNIRGSRFRRVALGRRRTPWPARPGQHPDGDVGRQPHVAGASAASGFSRICSARRCRTRRPASRPTCGQSVEPGASGDVAAPAARAAPRQPELRVVPRGHGSDRLRPRELRPDRQVARCRRRDAGQRRGPLVDGTMLDGPGQPAPGAPRTAASGRHGRRREAAHLRAGPPPRVSSTCRPSAPSSRSGSQDDYRFSSLVVGIVKSLPFQMKRERGRSKP